MALSRETELGKISISNAIFAQIIKNAFEQEVCSGKIWPSTRKGRQIGSDNKLGINEMANNIVIEHEDDGKNISMEFYVIIQFGQSISKITDAVTEYIANYLYEKQGRRPRQIKVIVTGVKSKQIAKRELEVIKNYEA